MTTDTVVMERALVVMAIAISAQTLIFVGVAIGAFVAWRRASLAFEDARAEIARLSATVEEVAGSVLRSTSAVSDAVSDVRDCMGTVGNSLHSAAAVVAASRTAVAMGLWRGVVRWRRRRASNRISAALPSEL